MILALDTTSEFGSIALVDESRAVDEILLHSPEGFGHVLFPQIEALLERNALQISRIECFAAASGPGSFTGVRVGLTAVKGLAEAASRPVVAVSNLRALAWFGTGAFRAPFLDARRGEIYGAMYDARLELIAPEAVMPFPAWRATLGEPGTEFITNNPAPFAAALAGATLTVAPRALASAVGRIALSEWRSGKVRKPEEIDANYVRRSDAELFWKE